MILAVYGCLSGMKCEYLDNLSTTTKIASYPLHLDFGRPVMKSMDTSSHTLSGIGSGCSNPPGDDAKYFCL
ncbi:hypothetical protein A2U01_0007071 [Trifolium medium]|uniref:Uncharacterized protein n=1 Tax=Trifolium medium TaxID=97028 RepID=A0A392MFD0_9FABA|nr:hypothetical protein [Trifolium medium]